MELRIEIDLVSEVGIPSSQEYEFPCFWLVPGCLGMGLNDRSSHAGQCTGTSAATSSSETPAQESSTFLHVQLFRCCGAGIQSDVRVLGLGEHRLSLRSGGGHLAQTILRTGRIWSSPLSYLVSDFVIETGRIFQSPMGAWNAGVCSTRRS